MQKGFFLLTSVVVAITGSSVLHAQSEFSLNGYIQNQTGVFFSGEEDEFDAEGFPSNHGDKRGEFSMFRNTLQLEGDWRPSEKVTLHGIFRGVRSSPLDADEYAQVPEPDAVPDPKQWVHDKYYEENEMRELYLDIDATRRLNFRIGRQQVTWGDTGQYRLLDVVNPIDGTWHLSTFESFEDTRIPLWIVKGLYDIPALDGNLEVVWVPAIDEEEDLVTVPLTLVGAWGLPLPPKQEKVSPYTIKKKVFMYPGDDLEDSRVGVRWKGIIGNLTYTGVYYYTHVISPPIPDYFIHKFRTYDIDVYLDFPRQQIAGLSLDYTFNYPIGTVVRLEAAVEPDRTYPVKSSVDPINPEKLPNDDMKFYFVRKEKTAVSYALVLSRSTFIRFLNPKESFMFVAQVFQTIIPDFKEEDNIIDVPGYDSTEVSQVSTKVILAVLTNYFRGAIKPVVVGIYDPGGSAILKGVLNFGIGNHWRVSLGANGIWGEHPYKSIGLFRDRDEVFATIRYQF
ncbi:MAG: hypothetical protein JSU92_03330 [Deltaproteobacteria bacterium]|nr:MAG: hypothetical protein JSU92_03330 [Deltaproteobacteria bacterium]